MYAAEQRDVCNLLIAARAERQTPLQTASECRAEHHWTVGPTTVQLTAPAGTPNTDMLEQPTPMQGMTSASTPNAP